jgi:hypothetical protein
MADEELRDYALIDIERYQCSSANPFTARVSTGGKYAELDTFSDWTIQDWHSGVGNSDPEAGPLFSMAETRYPGYLMPALGWEFPLVAETQAQAGTHVTSPIEFSLLNSQKYSVSFTATSTANLDGVWVYVHCPYYKELTVELRSNSSGAPGSVLKTVTVSSTQTRVHAHWVYAVFPLAQAVVYNTRYHITVSSNVATTLGSGIYPYMPTVVMSGSEKCYSSTNGGSTWALEGDGNTGFYYLLTYYGAGTNEVKGAYTTSNGKVFLWMDDVIYEVNSGLLDEIVTGAGTIYDVMQVDDLLYIALGTSYRVYNSTTFATTTSTADAYMLRLHSGFLWRSTGTTVSYTADEVTWTDLPDILGATGNAITGMAGLERELYFTTREGLFVAVSGDEILQICTWPEIHDDNGKNMIAWEGALYIPMYGGTIMRYDTSGALLNVGINAKEELPADLQGTVTHLKATNYFLMAVVETSAATGYSSLWSYNVDGWHCLALAPQGIGGGAIAIDRENDYLYWGMDRAILMRTDYPASINNPARNMDSVLWGREGWVEYDRFYGSNHTLDKDFDRIYIDAEQSGRNVHVYWQDDDNYADYVANHDGEMGWQYLGTLTTTGVYSIQFPAAARPGGRSFRLALRITNYNTVDGGPPVVRGLSVKFSTNVADRWRWVLPLAVHDNQQFIDGSINPYTAAEMLTHLDSLKNDTAPLQYRDIDGTSYYVKVTAASRQITRYQWLVGNEAPSIQWIYVLSLEQM